MVLRKIIPSVLISMWCHWNCDHLSSHKVGRVLWIQVICKAAEQLLPGAVSKRDKSMSPEPPHQILDCLDLPWALSLFSPSPSSFFISLVKIGSYFKKLQRKLMVIVLLNILHLRPDHFLSARLTIRKFWSTTSLCIGCSPFMYKFMVFLSKAAYSI